MTGANGTVKHSSLLQGLQKTDGDSLIRAQAYHMEARCIGCHEELGRFSV